MPYENLSYIPSDFEKDLRLFQSQSQLKNNTCSSSVKLALQRCPVCASKLTAAVTLSAIRRQEIVIGLRSAIKHWLSATCRQVTSLAREAGVHRSQLNRFLNDPAITKGPDVEFYNRLYAIEVRHKGYFDPLVVRLLRILCNYYVERH